MDNFISIEGHGQYISDESLKNKELENTLVEKKKTFLKCLAGSGKTTYLVKYGLDNFSRVIIAVPRKTIGYNFKARFAEYGAVFIDGSATSSDLEDARCSKLIIVTYDSLYKTQTFPLNTETDFLVIDEAHKMLESFRTEDAYSRDRIQYVFTSMETYQNVCLVSATPEPLLYNYVNAQIEVRTTPEHKTRLYKIVPENNSKDIAIKLAKNAIANKRKFLILYNGGLDKMEVISETIGGNIQLVHNDIYSLEQKPFYRKLLDESLLSKELDGIITTSKIELGNDILNELEEIDIILLNPSDPSTVVQFANRPRNAKPEPSKKTIFGS